jgi:hypothetical protein
MVYWIQEDIGAHGVGGGLVKIGYTRQSETLRLSALQVGNPRPLYIRARLENCGPATESLIHKRLKHYKVKGEWFLPSDTVLNAMKWAKSNPKAKPIEVSTYLTKPKFSAERQQELHDLEELKKVLEKDPTVRFRKKRKVQQLVNEGKLTIKNEKAKIAKFQSVCPDCQDYIEPGEELGPKIDGKHVHSFCTNLTKEQ